MLPIDRVLLSLKEKLRTNNNAVLIAPPGAGKTTRVPLALLNEPWLHSMKIVMLEPRRLAARAAAGYMAHLLGERLGETVGYRVRKDTRIGPNTRIEVITEGILTRMLQADPALEGVGAIILDEFHERSIQADLGLALALQAQSVLRPDFRILVMSATLEAEPVSVLLGDAPVIASEGRQYPVTTHYFPGLKSDRLEKRVSDAIVEALMRYTADILVFLPGAAEIRRTAEQLQKLDLGERVVITPLHGSMRQQEQDRALVPSPEGYRKVVLSTPIAETSLTVEGVGVVIDSGLMRVPKFSPRTGMMRLETVPVTQPASEQRRGRAGRMEPGACYRLWSEQEEQRLAPRNTPEILEADMTALALELAVWGVKDAAELKWLDVPPAAALQQARGLLMQLGALAGDGTATPHGRDMAKVGLHPRLAHMILKAKEIGLGCLGCELAAVLNERDIFSTSGNLSRTDVRSRLEILDTTDYRNVLREADFLKQEFRVETGSLNDIDQAGLLLAFAYPDRIAQRREDGRYLLRNGRGAILVRDQLLSRETYLVAADIDDIGSDGRILLAAPIELPMLREYFKDQIETEAVVFWDDAAQAVKGRQREKLGSIIVKETHLANPGREEVLSALLQGIRREGLNILPWNRVALQLLNRIRFMQQIENGWPDVSDAALLSELEDWLAPYLGGVNSRSDMQRLNLATIIEARLTWEQRQRLNEGAPSHIMVPSGQRIPLDYTDAHAPVLAVRLQEMFGLEDTPRIGFGRVPLTLHLLSPAHRPVQITKDLVSFWQNGYFEVRRDLLGRYPKHYWPGNPLEAEPTHRAKPKNR